ncbi:MAG: CvpA family protein, partial [bacterium]
VDNLIGDLLALFLGWMACYIAIILVGTILVKIIKGSSGSIKFLDRIMGGALGAAKGFLIIYLILCALVLFREPIHRVIPDKYLDLKGSRLAAFAEQHNLLSMIRMPDLDKLKELTQAFGDEDKRRVLMNDPALREIRQNKAFQRLMNDVEFHKAVDSKELSAILNNKSFREAINDPQIRKLLTTFDLNRASAHVERKGDGP